MAKLRDKLMKGGTKPEASAPDSTFLPSPAVPRELARLSLAWVKHGVFGLPLSLTRAALLSPALDGPLSEARFLDLFGESALRLFDELGPIYGKAGQVFLSRLSEPMHAVAGSLRLTRLYKDWPPLPWAEVEQILDEELPSWRRELTVEPHALGVASLAQVHAATDAKGRQWVVKIIKPQARRRLGETVAAMEQVLAFVSPLAVTQVSRRLVKDMSELCQSFRAEVSLTRERETILRVQERLAGKRQRALVLPKVHPTLTSDSVLVIERFIGTPLADLVTGKATMPAGARAKLARTMLSELLVQVFELGLFHGDPHAGNLILLENGSVGLYDWGLAGELMESDRRHIASILKAVIALDLEALIDALMVMGEEAGKVVKRDAVRHELKAVIAMIKAGREDKAKKPSLQAVFEACLNGAARLGIPVPDGLLLMAKSLITIEGLARGIDPQASLGRIAMPVLLRAARPGFKDMVALGRRLPDLARQLWVR